MPSRAPKKIWEMLMRYTPAAAVLALFLTTVSSTSVSAPAAQPIAPLSRDMQAEGERLAAAGSTEEAIGYFESALAADPRNADAYVGLGRAARVQQLPGKAIGFFREASTLDPQNRAALLGEGLALSDRGATARARSLLTRLQALCGSSGCAEASELGTALGAARTALNVSDVMPRPVAGQAPGAN